MKQLHRQTRGANRCIPSLRPFTQSKLHPAVRTLRQVQCQPRTGNVVARASQTASIADSLAKVAQLKDLVSGIPSLKESRVQPARFPSDVGDRVGFVTSEAIPQDGTVLTVSEDVAITRIDAEQNDQIAELAAEASELVALTLWMCAERQKGSSSAYYNFLSTLPASTLTPILWSDAEISELLLGSPGLAEAQTRKAALLQQWEELNAKAFSKDSAKFPASAFGKDAFCAAFSVVLANAVYLPSASCFALLPVASQLVRTGAETGCTLDYDADRKAVVVKTPKSLRSGMEVQLYDPRPSYELALTTGTLPDTNSGDFLLWDASLLQADRYFIMKAQILESLGFNPNEQFPVYADRFPTQLLSYLRLSRVADPALFAKVSFDRDIELSQMNEYEILQILMGDCREKLQAYALSYEEEVKVAQQRDLTPQQRLACKLRLEEKKIIRSTMDAVRRRLAPIRGIPTKAGGMQDPNSDLKEIFDAIESIPAAPARLVGNFLSWARGEQDPDWGKKPSDKPKAPRPW